MTEMIIDISSIRVRKAVTQADFQMVRNVRWHGYQKYFSHRDQVLDQYDGQDNCTLLLAQDDRGRPLGTMRLLDSELGQTEIEQFLAVQDVLEATHNPFVEANRFSVPHHPLGRPAKVALQKTYYLYCVANSINTMLVAVRSAAAREYRSFCFQDLGEGGRFHHLTLGHLEHHTMVSDLTRIQAQWRSKNHPLQSVMFDQRHPNLRFE